MFKFSFKLIVSVSSSFDPWLSVFSESLQSRPNDQAVLLKKEFSIVLRSSVGNFFVVRELDAAFLGTKI